MTSSLGELQKVPVMTVKEIGEKYRRNICVNEVTVTKVGGATLVCCGEDMEFSGLNLSFQTLPLFVP
jgi:desulfoferrodoxin-like iron-binding protein